MTRQTRGLLVSGRCIREMPLSAGWPTCRKAGALPAARRRGHGNAALPSATCPAMNYASRSIATAVSGAIALGPGSMIIPAQVTTDLENRYANVRRDHGSGGVDDAGKPVELRGFASGTLIRDRVMVTAGHFTAPAKALGSLPPAIRVFASFSPTDAKNPKTWIPVVRLATRSIDAALSAAAPMRPD